MQVDEGEREALLYKSFVQFIDEWNVYSRENEIFSMLSYIYTWDNVLEEQKLFIEKWMWMCCRVTEKSNE